MKRLRAQGLTILAMVAGLGCMALLVLHFGADAVGTAAVALGWGGFAATIGFHLCLIGLTGLAWWQLARVDPASRPLCFVWGRLIRDAAGEALPFSQLGGFVLGARAATLCGTTGRLAAATTVVDLTVELVAKLPYMLLGLAVLAVTRPDSRLIWPVVGGLLLMTALSALFFALQARSAGLIEKLGKRIADRWMGGQGGESGSVRALIHCIYARRSDVSRSIIVHFAGWVLSAVEVWLPLWLMGRPISLAAAIVIDSLLVAIRSVAFVIPNAIGLQEGAYVLLGGIFGVPPDTALALSLLRRGRDFAIGIPSLLAWQALEGRRAWRGLASF